MPIPPKKLKSVAAQQKKAKRPPDEELEQVEEDAPAHGEDEGGGERHMDDDEIGEVLTKAMNEVENGPDGKLVAAMGGYDGGGEAPEGFDSATWEAAQEITGIEDGADDMDGWMLVAHVYKHLGGEVPGADEDGAMPNEAEKDDDSGGGDEGA